MIEDKREKIREGEKGERKKRRKRRRRMERDDLSSRKMTCHIV